MAKSDQTHSLEFKFRTWPFDLSATEREIYSSVGYFVSQVAKLEFDIDSFILRFVSEREHLWREMVAGEGEKGSSLKRFPDKITEKVDFLIFSFKYNRTQLLCGDIDGYLDLNAIGYLIDELFDVRNIVVHGSIAIVKDSGGIVVESMKWTRQKSGGARTKEFSETTWRYSIEYLRGLVSDIFFLRSILGQMIMVLDGEDIRRVRDELLRGRVALRGLRSAMGGNQISEA